MALKRILARGALGLALILAGCSNSKPKEKVQRLEHQIIPAGQILKADNIPKDGDYILYKFDFGGETGSYAVREAIGKEAEARYGKEKTLVWYIGDKKSAYQTDENWIVAEADDEWKKQLIFEMTEMIKKGEIVAEPVTYPKGTTLPDYMLNK